MPVRFEVESPVTMRDRKLLALVGVIREGMPRVGMTATVTGDDGSTSFREPVHGVEYVDAPDDVSGLALTFHYSSREKLAGWLDLDWEGRILDLVYRTEDADRA
ncbi:MAG: hypothetical protein ACOC9H_02345 [Gemmatimonadota bacterium]